LVVVKISLASTKSVAVVVKLFWLTISSCERLPFIVVVSVPRCTQTFP
jgi:hypothetical protein